MSREKILRIYQISDSIFGTMGSHVLFKKPVRTGKRYLSLQLKGTDWNSYWPMTHREFLHPIESLYSSTHLLGDENDSIETFKNDTKLWSGALQSLPIPIDEIYRRTVIQRNIDRNKPTPKKGQGKRSSKGKK